MKSKLITKGILLALAAFVAACSSDPRGVRIVNGGTVSYTHLTLPTIYSV